MASQGRLSSMKALTPAGSQGVSRESLKMYGDAKKSQIGGTGNGIRNLMVGADVTTKVYPSDVIPERLMVDQVKQRGVFRLNNFLNDPYFTNQLGLGAQKVVMPDDFLEEGQDEELEVELTLEEFQYAVKMTDVSIRQLTK